MATDHPDQRTPDQRALGDTQVGPARKAVAQLPRTGDRLGKFVLGELLGQGGMALVFSARDENLSRQVAIKVLMPSAAAHKDGAERFRREALAVAAIKHGGIVEVFDFVAEGGNQCAYLVEELIAGPTLQELLERHGGRFLPEVAAVLVAEVAEALAAAHQKGVIHRDIKPANLMLEPVGDGARTVLTDFGVAHIGALTTMTATGAMVGSPAYMAPEQVRGRDIGPQADVWALGVLLYQLSTGHLPFAGRDPISVIAAISMGQYKRASQFEPRVGPELDRVITRCLKASPAERMPDAATLLRELRAITNEAGLPAAPALLRRVLDDAAGLEAELAPRLAAHAVARATVLIKERQLSRALAEIGRAGALAPGHPEARKAEQLMASISARQKTGRVLWIGVAALVLLAGGAAAWNGLRQGPAALERGAARAGVGVAMAPGPPPAPAPKARVATPTPVVVATAGTPAPETAPPVQGSQPVERARRPGSRGGLAAATRTVAPIATPPAPTVQAPVPPATDPLPDPAPAKPLMAVAPDPGRVRLYSRFGFCFPALDDSAAAELSPVYANVAAGEHQVFCAEKQGGAKQLVGTITVKPGARIERQIVPGADGKPAFSRIR